MEIDDTIGIPNYDEEELAVSDNVETTKFLCWDIPSEKCYCCKECSWWWCNSDCMLCWILPYWYQSC